jgi:hypothetical protein
MRATSHYVKGHMGGNLIALLWSEDTERVRGDEVVKAYFSHSRVTIRGRVNSG